MDRWLGGEAAETEEAFRIDSLNLNYRPRTACRDKRGTERWRRDGGEEEGETEKRYKGLFIAVCLSPYILKPCPLEMTFLSDLFCQQCFHENVFTSWIIFTGKLRRGAAEFRTSGLRTEEWGSHPESCLWFRFRLVINVVSVKCVLQFTVDIFNIKQDHDHSLPYYIIQYHITLYHTMQYWIWYSMLYYCTILFPILFCTILYFIMLICHAVLLHYILYYYIFVMSLY